MAWITRTCSTKLRWTEDELRQAQNNCPADVPFAVWLRHLALETPQRPLRIPSKVAGVTTGDPSETPPNPERPLGKGNEPGPPSGMDLAPSTATRDPSISDSDPDLSSPSKQKSQAPQDVGQDQGKGKGPRARANLLNYWLEREPFCQLPDPAETLEDLRESFPDVDHDKESRALVGWWKANPRKRWKLILRGVTGWWNRASSPQRPLFAGQRVRTGRAEGIPTKQLRALYDCSRERFRVPPVSFADWVKLYDQGKTDDRP